jgi:hypothetical protein
MLDRKTKLIILALFLVMMASDIWLVAHAVSGPAVPSFLAHLGRWLAILFLLPACMMICIRAWQWRMARAEGDLSAWTKWVRFLAICYAATGAGYQFWFAMTISKVLPLPSSLSLIRVLIAFFGLQLLVLGNWKAKLPPLKTWLPASLSLSAAGEATILRLEGWLLVAYGLIVIATAFLIPISLIAPLFTSMSLALLIVIIIRRRQLRPLTH